MTKNTKAPALQREIRLRPRNECNAGNVNYLVELKTGYTYDYVQLNGRMLDTRFPYLSLFKGNRQFETTSFKFFNIIPTRLVVEVA